MYQLACFTSIACETGTYIDTENSGAAPGNGRYVTMVTLVSLHHCPLPGGDAFVIAARRPRLPKAKLAPSNLAPSNWDMTTTQSDQPMIPVPEGRPFRLLLAGSTVSMLGTRMSTIAFPMLVLWVTGSPVAAGWMAFAATAPSILVYMPAGALVDLWPPRRVMLVSEFGRGIAIASVVVMLCVGRPSIYLLICAAVVEETLEVFSTLAERRYVSLLAGHEKASSAMVQLEARTHVVVLTGRPLGGFLFTAMPILPFIADVLSFIISVSTLLRIRRRQTTRFLIAAPAKITSFLLFTGPAGRPQAPGSRASWQPITTARLWDDIHEGWLWLQRDRFAQVTIALSAATTLICQALIMIFLDYAHSQHLSSLTIGIALAGSGLGGALGSFIASRLPAPALRSWTPIRRYAWALAILVLLASENLSLWPMILVMSVLGFTGALGNVELGTYLIQQAPGDMLARATSVGRLISFTACALGPMLGGIAIHQCGIRGAVLLLSAAVSIMSIFSLLMPSSREKRIDVRPILRCINSGVALFCSQVKRPYEILAGRLTLVRKAAKEASEKTQPALVPARSQETSLRATGGPSVAFTAGMAAESVVLVPGGQPGIGNSMYAE
jgi:MFS family permease